MIHFIKRLIALAAIATLAFAFASAVHAQDLPPDSRGEAVVSTPSYGGERANAPIPPKFHIRNEGGSDGAGLCVISSIVINGAYQGIRDLLGLKESGLWRAAKAAPGGYSPDKLQRLLSRVMPQEKYASYTGTDDSVLERWSRRGYPIGATMNTGRLYGYKYIHHMISLIHYRKGGSAIVVDSNDPGKYHVMPAAEFARRWPDGGTAWGFAWLRLPAKLPRLDGAGAEYGVSVLILAFAVLASPVPDETEV